MLKALVVVVYVAVMLVVGYICMRRTRTVGDFFLGNRSLGPWLSAFAYGTTYFSAVIFIGYAGKLGWGFGLHTMWIVVGNALVGSLLAWQVLGPRTRNMTGRLNTMTMPDFLAIRYESKLLKIFAALVVFVFLVPYSASIYKGLSELFAKNFDIRYEYALAFLALLTGVYIMMGGYLALAWTDFIRGIIELFGVIVMVVYLANKVGGFSHATAELMNPAYAPGLAKSMPIPGWAGMVIPGWLTFASLVLITSFGPWGLPQMVQKFYSIKSELEIRSATIICTIFALVMAFGAYYSGALTHLYYASGLPVEVMPVGGKPDFDKLMPFFLTTETPAVVSMILLLLVFSASMSSLSSLVLVSSSAIAMDLFAGILRPNASKNSVLLLMRVLCLVFVGVSLFIALMKPLFIVELMVISWGALAGAFIAPYMYGLFWRGATKAGAIVAMFSGVGLAAGLYIKLGEGGIPVSAAVAMIAPSILLPIVSSFTRKPAPALIAQAFGDAPAMTQPAP